MIYSFRWFCQTTAKQLVWYNQWLITIISGVHFYTIKLKPSGSDVTACTVLGSPLQGYYNNPSPFFCVVGSATNQHANRWPESLQCRYQLDYHYCESDPGQQHFSCKAKRKTLRFIMQWFICTVIHCDADLQNTCTQIKLMKTFYLTLNFEPLFSIFFFLLFSTAQPPLYILSVCHSSTSMTDECCSDSLPRLQNTTKQRKPNHDTLLFCLLKCHFIPEQVAGGDPALPWNGFKAPRGGGFNEIQFKSTRFEWRVSEQLLNVYCI